VPVDNSWPSSNGVHVIVFVVENDNKILYVHHVHISCELSSLDIMDSSDITDVFEWSPKVCCNKVLLYMYTIMLVHSAMIHGLCCCSY